MSAAWNRYSEFCERLWGRWKRGWRPEGDGFDQVFETDAMPEPYLLHGDPTDALAVLLTNPGGVEDFQRAVNIAIAQGDEVVTLGMTYQQVARELHRFYRSPESPINLAARKRFQKIDRIARDAGFRSLLQVEVFPWHSIDLKDKPKALRLASEHPELGEYLDMLEGLLKGRPVVAIKSWNGGNALPTSPWLKRIYELIGLRPDEAELRPLKRKGSRATVAVAVDEFDGRPRVLSLKVGSNQLPSENDLPRIVQLLKPEGGTPGSG